MRNLAGLLQVHARVPSLFGGSNRMRWHFLSHRFARLALPWVLLIGVGAAAALPAGWLRFFLIAGEAALIVVALADPAIPRWFPLKRLSSPARTFLIMNAAALLAVSVFFVPPQLLWRPTRVQTGKPTA
jgi:hypothetical protein